MSKFLKSATAGILGLGLLTLGSVSTRADNTEFSAEFTRRKDAILDITETWAYEKLGLSSQEIRFEARLIFPAFDSREELWHVDVIDSNDNVVASLHVDRVTGELDELIPPPESSIEVNGMNVILVDHTQWQEIENVDTLYSIEEAFTTIAKAIHEEFEINVNNSKFAMFLLHSSRLDSYFWIANVLIDSGREIIKDGSPDIIPDFIVWLDASTGVITSISKPKI